MTRREQKKAESRRRILDAAREVFFREGFMAANLDEVAEKARVAKGTLYRYFESKAELYVAVLAHNGEIFESKVRATLSPELTPPDQVRRTARFYLDHYIENPAYFQIFWAMENQPVIGELPAGVVEEVAKLWDQCMAIMEKVIERGTSQGFFRECDPWEVAHLLWTIANAMIQSETSSTRRQLRRVSLERAFENAIEIVLRGIAPRGDATA